LLPQPTDTSCGPTCLQAVYNYYGDHFALGRLITEVQKLEDGGTLSMMLALHALKRGYDADLYTYNLRIFDPTWFQGTKVKLEEKMREQVRVRSGKRKLAAAAYLEFLEAGGRIHFEDLTGALIRRYLQNGIPILAGLSSTFLYRSMREISDTCEDDDVNGEPQGHFVLLNGYTPRKRLVSVADPYQLNPLSKGHCYELSMERLINAILLGVLTYDGNLLILRPKKGA